MVDWYRHTREVGVVVVVCTESPVFDGRGNIAAAAAATAAAAAAAAAATAANLSTWCVWCGFLSPMHKSVLLFRMMAAGKTTVIRDICTVLSFNSTTRYHTRYPYHTSHVDNNQIIIVTAVCAVRTCRYKQ